MRLLRLRGKYTTFVYIIRDGICMPLFLADYSYPVKIVASVN